MLFAGNFAPRGWAFCDGSLLSIAQNNALFALLGTMYGGDGRTTFALPDLRGRAPMHRGHGPGLPDYRQGMRGGRPSEPLTPANLPPHTHTMKPRCSNAGGSNTDPSAGYQGVSASDDPPAEYSSSHNATMAEQVTESAGGSAPVDSQDPYLAVNYCIALLGQFPSRS